MVGAKGNHIFQREERNPGFRERGVLTQRALPDSSHPHPQLGPSSSYWSSCCCWWPVSKRTRDRGSCRSGHVEFAPRTPPTPASSASIVSHGLTLPAPNWTRTIFPTPGPARTAPRKHPRQPTVRWGSSSLTATGYKKNWTRSLTTWRQRTAASQLSRNLPDGQVLLEMWPGLHANQKGSHEE